jgi:Protein of unknown function (DUF2489)
MYSFLIWSAIAVGVLVSIVLVRYIVKSVQSQKLSAQASSPGVAENLLTPNAPSQSSHSLPVEESLLVLVSSLLEGQVEVAEASIRLKVLLDHYDASLHDDPRFSIFNVLYEALEHMPTHQARKQTDKRFLNKLDQERLRLEAKHRDNVMNAAQVLKDRLLLAK